jgi:branched-subunit amino acid aminotransferase/4-amino-4-deoxychorismate lyase
MKQIDIDSPAVAHGLGLFETMLVSRGRVVLREEHLERMTNSAFALGLPAPDEDAFRAFASNEEEAAMRVLHVAASPSEWTLSAQTIAIPPLTLARRMNATVITFDPSFTRALPEHKMTSYAPCVIGLRRAVMAGANEGLFVDREGHILEGTASNVFAVTRDSLITAPSNVLPGIMRAWVLEQATQLGIAIEERAPSQDELRAGSFLTGSLTLMAAVRSIDDRPCREPGEIFDAINSRWLY